MLSFFFNLGGPDHPNAVEPFLINLFSDPAIISLPQPFRGILAKFIGKRRARVARPIYEKLGGGSPLLPNTKAQAQALEEKLTNQSLTAKVFIAMRYWHPMTKETVQNVLDFAPDKIILLPLYPQFSTTTSRSSLRAWQEHAKKAKLNTPSQAICCYPKLDGFINAMADLVNPIYEKSQAMGPTKLLFSAHGLPKKIIDRGDPYQWQVEQTAQGLVDKLKIKNLDWQVCYQSRVGPLEWIGPSTDQAIIAAGKAKQNIVLCPIAFVSEHSETLVELDIEYRHLAEENGVAHYFRVPTVGCHEAFINGLADMVLKSLANKDEINSVNSNQNKRLCPKEFCGCAQSP